MTDETRADESVGDRIANSVDLGQSAWRLFLRDAIDAAIAEMEQRAEQAEAKIAQFIHGEAHPDVYVTREQATALRDRAEQAERQRDVYEKRVREQTRTILELSAKLNQASKMLEPAADDG